MASSTWKVKRKGEEVQVYVNNATAFEESDAVAIRRGHRKTLGRRLCQDRTVRRPCAESETYSERTHGVDPLHGRTRPTARDASPCGIYLVVRQRVDE